MKRFIAMLLCAVLVVCLCIVTAPEKEYVPQAKAYVADDYSQIYTAVRTAMKSGATRFGSDVFINEADDTVSSTDHSGTTVQVQGIDEGDCVKTDGEYIYSLCDNKLHIFKADGENTAKVCMLNASELADGDLLFTDMYVSGERLILIGSKYFAYDNYIYTKTKQRTQSCIFVFDIQSKSAPRLISTASQDGIFESSRLYGDKLYVVSSLCIVNDPDEDEPESYVPTMRCNGKAETMDCDRICLMAGSPDASYTVLCEYDAISGENTKHTAVLGGGNLIYMSYEAIYVASADYTEETIGSYTEDQYNVEKIKTTQETNICRISLSDFKLSGSCTVPGVLDGQFAMDEYNGMFRVVACVSNDIYNQYTDEKHDFVNIDWSEEESVSENALYVFDEQLKPVASIEGLAKDEFVRSVRFDGEYAYFCTFREVDPLFAVCLKDPKNPVILSEYKISGFSEYLYPWTEGRLLGFGYEAVENDAGKAVTTGLKLVMFDTSDKSNVTAKNALAIPGGDSEASYNHKAMLVAPEKNLIGFAVANSYCVYSYTEAEGFALQDSIACGELYYGARGLYIGDTLYVVAGDKVVKTTLI